ncbi:unnamed protein product [Cuscuta epithymum]|uniref:FAD/NAD(P)-binding domain-containing protein n=3 Tax=Cuscuta epithymum TaxID=186058 RepID=A0AAV0GFQ7_9ASTE|nr:unnamed protein product [Cuscuta epithymum]CAH9146784.1 unnamed protein product [Cuscuta epithymum]CAH9146785.1 unnamed protein product [Cuscuta epithymum]
MMGSSMAEKKKVVIVGGGAGGSLLAYTLQNYCDVILIDSKEYFEITWASLRSMVEPSFAKRAVINHSEYLHNARIISSPAINITRSEVLTEQGEGFAYDYLVVATGHLDNGSSTRNEKLHYYQEENDNIKAANSILIVGGGPTGVELAAEIAVEFPDKKVTLVHKGSRLLQFIGEKAGKKAFDWLISKKVEVILKQSVNLDSASDGVYWLSGGETISADRHYVCAMKPFATSWLKDTDLRGSLDDQGKLMVDANLRVKGHNNIFAIGDIVDTKELKQGYIARNHALLVAKNVKLLISGAEEQKMAKYKPGPTMAIVSLGRREAVMQVGCITISGRIPGMIKSGDLFVGKARKELGLKS